LIAGLVSVAPAQSPVKLPEVTVHSTRVANQSSAAAFAMPVSALRYEPQVDIHGRNLAEAQADITIRGGIFENTGMQLGAISILDPQTGHYLGELPVAPAMVGAPRIVTGADLALSAANATVGAIAYEWRRIRTAGAASVGMGENRLRRAEFYQGALNRSKEGGRRIGVDAGMAYSRSDGAVPWGDHEFSRANIRFQHATSSAQTDLVAGYQGKRFGWPNRYTPFNSNEQENLQTTLLLLNHRVERGAGEHWEAGVFHRRNKDDYAFDRFAPLGAVHPFQHTTWVSGGAVATRRIRGDWVVDFKGELLADEIESTSLTSGRFRTRTLTKSALLARKNWRIAGGGPISARAGIVHDDSNRDPGRFSPQVEVAREIASAGLKRVYLSYAGTSQVATYTALNSSPTAGLFRGNANLGRSTSRNLELGGSGSVAGWLTEAAAFWREDLGLIDWTFRRGVTARTANPVDIDVAGLELVSRRSWAAGDVVIGYTWLGKGADYRGAAVDASFYALNYARHRLTAACSLRLGRAFEIRLDNAIRWQAGNLLRVVGGDRALLSAIGLFYRPLAVRGIEISVRVDNAWDDPFQEVPAVPASPRQFSTVIAYTW
jgi:hypothetical protein